jgi:hypothetical protein
MHNPFRRKPAPSVPKIDVATAKKLMDQLGDPTVRNPLCAHCGCYHTQACPRVKRIKFKSADVVEEVEFWSEWDKTVTITPEVIAEISLQTEVEDVGTKT